MEALIERKYVVTAPTTGTDGINPKIDSDAQSRFWLNSRKVMTQLPGL